MNTTKHIAILGGAGKLGKYLVEEALAKGYQVTVVCRPQSADKLAPWKNSINIVPAYTDDRDALKALLPKVDAVLTVLVPWGVNGYATKTAEAVLDYAPKNVRLIFSCGWHISRGTLVVTGKINIPLGLNALLLSLASWPVG